MRAFPAENKTYLLTLFQKILEDVQPGRQVIAWYSAVAQSYPGQAYTTHLMLLPEAEQTVEDSEAIGSTEND